MRHRQVRVQPFQAVAVELEFFDDRGEPDEDVGTAAEVEAIARHDFIRHHGTSDEGAAFKYSDAETRLRQIGRGHERVLTGSDDERR